MAIQFVLYLCASIALTVSTGVYLWDKETDTICYANEDKKQTIGDDDKTDVHERFNVILKIYFAVFITEVVRSAFMLIAILTRKAGIAKIYQLLSLNDCLAFAALIILHVYRFRPSGKYCSGDYLREDGASEDDLDKNVTGVTFMGRGFLIERGRFLLGLVIWVWVGGIGLCLLTCILSLLAMNA